MSLKGLVLAVPLSVALLCANPILAWADDEAPAPKRVRIKLKKAPAKGDADKAARPAAKSPMSVIRSWLMGKVGESMAGAKAGQGDMLTTWFDGGDDVPLADLRDALKGEGWTAASLKAWMVGEFARRGPQMMQLFSSRAGGPQGGPRTFTWFGPQDGHGHQTSGGHPGWQPNQRRPMPFGRGQRGGPGTPHGFNPHRGMGGRRGPPWGRRNQHGSWRRGGPRRGFPGQGFPRQGAPGQGFSGGRSGPQPMGPMGRPGAHTQRRAIIYWNDGSGWRQSEVPGGAHGVPGMHGIPGMGRRGHPTTRTDPRVRLFWNDGSGGQQHAMPGGSHPMPGRSGAHTPGGWVPGRPGRPGGPGMPGTPGTRGRPAPGAQGMQGMQGMKHLQGLMKVLQGLQNQQGLDADALKHLLEALKQHGVQIGAAQPAPGAAKKIRVMLRKPHDVEVVHEVELKQVGPGR